MGLPSLNQTFLSVTYKGIKNSYTIYEGKMKFTFNTNYTEDELLFIEKHHIKIITELKLSHLSSTDKPKRMIQYGRTYLAEIEEDGELYWAVLDKWRDKYHFSQYYPDLQSMVDGL